MGAWHPSGGIEDRLQLAPQDGDPFSILGVRPRRKQADEPAFTGRVSCSVELLHADRVHAHAAVHRRLRVRLVEHEQRRARDAFTHVRRQRVEGDGSRKIGAAVVAQEAKPRARLHHCGGSCRRLDHVVSPEAEEDEAALAEPAQELLHFLDLLLPGRRPVRRLLQVGHRLVQSVHHCTEVRCRNDDVLQARPQAFLQPLRHVRIVERGNLAVDHRLARVARRCGTQFQDLTRFAPHHPHYGMQEPLDRQALHVQVFPQRVHDEGTLRDVRADDGDRAIPRLRLVCRVADCNLHTLRPRLLQVPERR
jgi:hypothetical protein